uniref:Restriction endonuclease n=1 Tax=candidate division WOR-3 bacterium TaxID=2052148 RepID=A0A7V0Z6A2_UNCW3
MENNLKTCHERYHSIIEEAFSEYWRKYLIKGEYNSGEFLTLLSTPRDVFIEFCRENQLNYSSVAGTILEWTIFHFIKAGLSATEKDKTASVVNRYTIPFKWKTKGNKQVRIDIVIKSNKTKKQYYAFEAKTNFEDGFKKFREEEKLIYHHRRKNFKHFKYYYLSLNLPPQEFEKKFKRDIKRLIGRKELYILNKHSGNFPGIDAFLKSIVASISNIKEML